MILERCPRPRIRGQATCARSNRMNGLAPANCSALSANIIQARTISWYAAFTNGSRDCSARLPQSFAFSRYHWTRIAIVRQRIKPLAATSICALKQIGSSVGARTNKHFTRLWHPNTWPPYSSSRPRRPCGPQFSAFFPTAGRAPSWIAFANNATKPLVQRANLRSGESATGQQRR